MTMPAYSRRPVAVLAAVEIGLRDLGLSRLYLSACSLKLRTDPDVKVRGEDPMDLRDMINRWIGLRGI